MPRLKAVMLATEVMQVREVREAMEVLVGERIRKIKVSAQLSALAHPPHLRERDNTVVSERSRVSVCIRRLRIREPRLEVLGMVG